jgi:hypothetical protein
MLLCSCYRIERIKSLGMAIVWRGLQPIMSVMILLWTLPFTLETCCRPSDDLTSNNDMLLRMKKEGTH